MQGSKVSFPEKKCFLPGNAVNLIAGIICFYCNHHFVRETDDTLPVP